MFVRQGCITALPCVAASFRLGSGVGGVAVGAIPGAGLG
jgi:hypothetical protein